MYTSEKYQLVDYSEGTPGRDGSDIEYVYYRCAGTAEDPAPTEGPTYNNDNRLTPERWKASPQGITSEKPYEYVSIRTKPAGTNQEWSSFSTPTLWAKWGDKGMDGDGVEYLFWLSEENETEDKKPPTPASMEDAKNNNWTDEPRGITKTRRFEYVCVVTTTHENGVEKLTFAPPVLWTKYSEDGADAKDFNITASAYALKKGEDDKYLNSITLTAHRINITDDIKWYEWNVENNAWKEITSEDAKDDTLLIGTSLEAGDYKATCGDFEDYITIVEIEDGKSAISIVLSNPNMTFHVPANGSTSGQSEQCEVIVYEGGNRLRQSSDQSKGTYNIKATSNTSDIDISGSSIIVSEPQNNGKTTIVVSVVSTDGTNSSQDFEISWKITYDGLPGLQGIQGEQGTNGDTSETIFAYFTTSSTTAPNVPTGAPSNENSFETWTSSPVPEKSNKPYVYRTTGIKKTPGNGGDPSYSSWTTPELYSAYVENATGQQGAEFLKLFGLNQQDYGMRYAKNKDGTEGKLYINAEMIQAGQLSVRKDATNTNSELLFSAGWDDKGDGSVTIAGWKAADEDQALSNEGIVICGKNTSRKGTSLIDDKQVSVAIQTETTYTQNENDKTYEISNGRVITDVDNIETVTINKIHGTADFTFQEYCMFDYGDPYVGTNSNWISPFGFVSTSKHIATGASWDDAVYPVTVRCYNLDFDDVMYNFYPLVLEQDCAGTIVAKIYVDPEVSAIATSYSIGGFTYYTGRGYVVYSGNQEICKITSISLPDNTKPNVELIFDKNMDEIELGENKLTLGIGVFARYPREKGVLCQPKGNIIEIKPALNDSYSTYVFDKVELDCSGTVTSFSLLNDGSVFCGAAQIKQGHLGGVPFNSNGIQFGAAHVIDDYGVFSLKYGNDGDYIESYVYNNEEGLQACLTSLEVQDLTVENSFDDNSGSDIRIKHAIGELPEQYEAFYDKISPVRYKYKQGTSDRYHTGFIAQSLVQALEESGLTTKDFAGVVLRNPNTPEEKWYLRRDEFVALNTWQIQKLKKRLMIAEETIGKYEDRISKLESQISSLLNK